MQQPDAKEEPKPPSEQRPGGTVLRLGPAQKVVEADPEEEREERVELAVDEHFNGEANSLV